MKLYTRMVGILTSLLLLLIILTYRSFETNYVFYLSWLSALLAGVLYSGISLFRLKISIEVAYSLFVIFIWVMMGIIVMMFAYNQTVHLKTLILTTFYMVTSVLISDLIIRSKINLESYTYYMFLAWTIINFILLILFFLGIYHPQKFDFSGVFHDRNVFSITTLLVIGISFSHFRYNGKSFYKVLMLSCLFLCISMIIISKSITGLLGLFVLAFAYSFRLSVLQRVIIAIVLLASLIIVIFTDNPLSARITRFAIALSGDTDSLNTNESAYLRLYLMKSGFDLAMNHPIFGLGLDNAKFFVTWPDRGYGSFLHNTYLDILTSGGFPLFIIYYSPIAYCLIWLITKRRKVIALLDKDSNNLWRLAFICLLLKLVYDMTWTTYFEFFMVFTVVFSIYIVFFLKRKLILMRTQILKENV
ncbi:hypothetical protein BCS95_15025 [Vibrio breoganii]|uniref:O-antigen ligase family protein n=1 Tax=Vibrio breoganii TaxID=553239 RepID=UPI000C848913|nr:O-antigen ligase family protein [Vibrio breoganii]PMP01116.1 hypothetical protein BCS95_15025 [Vibrio breoganii]